jgi:serine/threonine-protein kinase
MADPVARLSAAVADRYVIERELGRGGMATVYLARDLKHDRAVALKVLAPELAATVGHERFLREIAIAAKLHHPNILGLLDSGDADGLLFYVMPYVEGESLSDRLAREEQLPLEDALRITRDVASALSHAHSLGIVHRDIKPGNILLSGDHTVVADFGIAKAVTDAGGDTLTETGLAVGTPAYMSPEQAAGRKGVDARTDVYSLGCVFYHMVVGEPPFTGPSAQAVLARHAIDPVSPLSTVRSTVPAGIDQAVATALAKVPADRHTTAVRFVEALERATAAPVETRGTTGRHPPLTWAIGTLAVLLVVVGGWWTTSRLDGTRIERLAVLPPLELGTDPEQAPIVQGMYNGLLTELGQAGVRVIGGLQSMLRYQGTDMTVPQIAAELGVDAIVEPSVFWVGDSVGISVRLIDGRTEESLWSHSYDADARNLIALYREVTRAIAGEIQVALTPAGEARLAVSKPVDPAAQEAYLRGQFFANQLIPASLDSGLVYFERALAIDSTYAPAYAGISWVWTAKRQLSLSPPSEATPKGIEAAARALHFDSLLAEAHEMRAWAEGWSVQNWELMEREYRRALELDPSSAAIRGNYSHVLLVQGRFEEAKAYADSGVALDPFNSRLRGFRAMVYQHIGHAELAREEFESLVQSEPGNVWLRSGLIGTSKLTRRYDDVIDLWAQQLVEQGMTDWADSLRLDYATHGYQTAMGALGDRFAALLEQGLEFFGGQPLVTLLYAEAGDVEATLAGLERQYEERHPDAVYMAPAANNTYAFIRHEPRFQALLRKLRLEWALEQPWR